jgi:raffinose/stachyose/melibiose transport system permease protein
MTATLRASSGAGRVSARTRALRALVTTSAAVFAVVEVGTPLWMIVGNSFASERQAGLLNFFPKGTLSFSNYIDVVRQGAFFTGLKNTALIAVPAVALVMLVGSMAAWVIARTRTRWSSFAYYLLLGGIFVPPSVVTVIFVLEHLHLYGSYLGLIFVYTGLFLSFALFLFTGFCRVIPRELEEAARIDGANWFTVFGRVVLPLMRPILFTAGVLLLVAIWNDFQYQFFLLSGGGSGTQTLTTSLYTFTESSSGSAASAAGGFSLPWNLIFADVVLTSLPLTLVFALAQRRLTDSLLTGALNG